MFNRSVTPKLLIVNIQDRSDLQRIEQLQFCRPRDRAIFNLLQTVEKQGIGSMPKVLTTVGAKVRDDLTRT